MKKYVNGKYIIMTEEELNALKSDDVATTEPTLIERLEAIESFLLEGVLMGD